MTLGTNESLPSFSVSVDTPDGSAFVHVIERDNKPIQVIIQIGKAGTDVAAWADVVGRLITCLFQHSTVHEVITEVSGITSGRMKRLQHGETCRSGPEGIAMALSIYLRQKNSERPARKWRPGEASSD